MSLTLELFEFKKLGLYHNNIFNCKQSYVFLSLAKSILD